MNVYISQEQIATLRRRCIILSKKYIDLINFIFFASIYIYLQYQMQSSLTLRLHIMTIKIIN